MEISVVEGDGKRLHHTKAYYDGPIGKAKVVHPSPGWRGMFFRDGADRYVTHFSNKGDASHKKDMKDANSARDEHFRRKKGKGK